MKSVLWPIFFCSTVLVSSLTIAAQAPSILEPKFERQQGPPLWISAEAVADAEKIVNLDLVDSHHLRGLVEKQRRSLGEPRLSEYTKAGRAPAITAISPAECAEEVLTSDHRGGWHPSSTLGDLVTYSQSILRGTVRTIEPGFASGDPSSLLGIELSRVIKGNASKSPFYIVYPVAHFKIGPFSFCNADKGFEPHPGDEILLFDYVGPSDRDEILYAPRLDQLFFQSRDGGLFLPSRLKNTPDLRSARSLDDITNEIQSGGLHDSSGSEQ